MDLVIYVRLSEFVSTKWFSEFVRFRWLVDFVIFRWLSEFVIIRWLGEFVRVSLFPLSVVPPKTPVGKKTENTKKNCYRGRPYAASHRSKRFSFSLFFWPQRIILSHLVYVCNFFSRNMYTSMYVHTYKHVWICIYACVWMCIYIEYTYTYVNVQMPACTHNV